jgi:hypothetical protein
MRTARLTVLLKEDEKAEWEARAARRGVSVGEYVRRKVEDEDELTAEQEAELAALVAQANEAIPKMRESLDRSIDIIESTRREVDAMLREAGLRK